MDQAPRLRQRRPVSSAERRRTAPAPRRARPARPGPGAIAPAPDGPAAGRFPRPGIRTFSAARWPACSEPPASLRAPPTRRSAAMSPTTRASAFGIPAQLLGQVGHHLGQRRVAGNMRGLGHVRRLTAGQARQRQFSGETVSVTSGTTAGSDSSASPSLPMVRPSENPPSAKRTVLPAWRTRRSRAQSSRFNSMLSAWAKRDGVGRNGRGSMKGNRQRPRGGLPVFTVGKPGV